MEKSMLAPQEIAEAMVGVGIKKAGGKLKYTGTLGLMAGLYIAMGACGSILTAQTLGHIDVGMAKFFAGVVFSLGLVAVLLAGGELFTGNILLVMAWADKKITLPRMLRNWGIVYVFNAIGALFFAWLSVRTGLMKGGTLEYITKLAASKTTMDTMTLFLKGIGCNILVCLGVWIAASAKDTGGKIAGIFFPILVFVITGFEHCVANMYYLPTAYFTGFDLTVGMVLHNLIPVTLGNIVGGAMIGLPYYFVYLKK